MKEVLGRKKALAFRHEWRPAATHKELAQNHNSLRCKTF
jgi:hypothetical protein